MHGFQGFAYAEHKLHKPPLAEARMIDQVSVDHVLQVATAVVWEENINGLAGAAATIVSNAGDRRALVGLNCMVDTRYYIRVWGE